MTSAEATRPNNEAEATRPNMPRLPPFALITALADHPRPPSQQSRRPWRSHMPQQCRRHADELSTVLSGGLRVQPAAASLDVARPLLCTASTRLLATGPKEPVRSTS